MRAYYILDKFALAIEQNLIIVSTSFPHQFFVKFLIKPRFLAPDKSFFAQPSKDIETYKSRLLPCGSGWPLMSQTMHKTQFFSTVISALGSTTKCGAAVVESTKCKEKMFKHVEA